ncbi:MAG: GAF domain-containing protein [Actinobacteria bacterium]|nr:GAF domain-containing protein [Actinomycetota bacterium]
MAAQRNPWVAIDAGADRRDRARRLARAHESALAGEPRPPGVRDLITRSWRRSSSAGVDPQAGLAPLALTPEEAEEEWRRSPLAVAEAVIRRLLQGVGAEGRQVALVCDGEGNLLWIDGERAVLEGAREVHLDRGARWSESAAGTNAMGTALALDHPLQVFSAEHFSMPVHGWTCSAAPIHDPETGEVVGVIDLSGELKTAHPHSLALVEMAARMIEVELAGRREREHRALVERFGDRVGRSGARGLVSSAGTVLRDSHRNPAAGRLELPDRGGVIEMGGVLLVAEPLDGGGFLLWPTETATAAGGDAALGLRVLGSERAEVAIGKRRFELSRRQTEVLILLVLHAEGLTTEQLALELHGDLGKPVTARAEISRLRASLRLDLGTRPYRLPMPVRADFLEVGELIRRGRTREAFERYPGPMLPFSEAPAIVEAREALDHSLREAVLASADLDLMYAWLQSPAGRDDLDVCRHLATDLPRADPRRAATLSRLRRLSGTR